MIRVAAIPGEVLRVGAICALHAAVLAWLLTLPQSAGPESSIVRMDVRTIDEAPPPPPPPPQRIEQRRAASAPPPLLAAAADSAASPAPFVVPPAPPSQPSERSSPAPIVAAPVAAAPEAPPPAVTAPRFDADYLNNPPPEYPPLSRRRGESGRVLLLVKVTPQGLPESVLLERSSGYTRLDEAALAAVKRWRFVPARRGKDPMAASVLVPIDFRQDG